MSSSHDQILVEEEQSLPYRILDPISDRQPNQASTPYATSSDFTSSPKETEPSLAEKISSLNLAHRVDFRAITYDGNVDENLVCPICRCPFVQPVDTSCDHTFCRECIVEAAAHSDLCPVDRSKLAGQVWTQSAKIIFNQLDNLKAKCPCCRASVPRATLEIHLEKYCGEALIRCPGKNMDQGCDQRIRRKRMDEGCLHFTVPCPECQEVLLRVDMENHREFECASRFMNCIECGEDIARCKEKDHEEECPMAMVACKWQKFGCLYTAKRCELLAHLGSCPLMAVGTLAESMYGEIANLRSNIRTLTETNQTQERRIKFLENTTRDLDRHMDLSELSDQALSSLPRPGSMDSDADEYVMSLLESQESRLGQLSAGMTELEAKQTTMLFNETIPIKTELAEIRSMQQTTSMHVRWLMRFRMQENSRFQNRTGGVLSNVTTVDDSSAAGPSSESFPTRRTSDSASRDLITKL